MNMLSLLLLIIGLILGTVITWLYLKTTRSKNQIDANEFENLILQLKQKEQSLAVMQDREENQARKVRESDTLIEGLRDEVQELKTEKGILRTQKDTAEARFTEISQENLELKRTCKQVEDELNKAVNEIVRLEQDLKGKEDRLINQKRDFDEIKQNLEKEFKAIAGNILVDNSKTFTDQQTTKLDDLLKPFRQQIETFKNEFDTKFTNEAMEKGSLKQQIESLVNLNQTLAKEALALTEALRGSTKKQGDWGEDILERILEYSGLQKNVHYFVQEQSKNDDGKSIKPDIIVRYPDTRFLVIDAKVSITHYWDYCNTDSIDEQKLLLPQIVNSIKNHVDGLVGRRYTDIANTPDFIVMFVPVEAAYITAMQQDHSLWQYAYDRKILIISPTNLLPAMKMVSIMWDKDAINRDGELIVSKAVKLYEKFHGFISTFESIGSEIEQAHKKWTDARGQLHTGRDNFITQGVKLKALLGKRSIKVLPEPLIDLASIQDDSQTEQEDVAPIPFQNNADLEQPR